MGRHSALWYSAQNEGRLATRIVQLERRIVELEAIEREYKRLNGELRQQIDKLFNKLTEMGVLK